MEKKHTAIGILCFIVAIALGFQAWSDQKKIEQYRLEHPEAFAANGTLGNTTGNSTAPSMGAAGSVATPATASTTVTPDTKAAAPTTPAATALLSNDEVDVTFTEDGGAIQTIALKKFPAKLHSTEPVIFNAGAPRPALALTVPSAPKTSDQSGSYWTWTGSAVATVGDPGMPPLPLVTRYTLDPATTTKTSVTFKGSTANGLEITRTYSLSSGNEDHYLIHHTTTIANHGTSAVSLERLFVNAGMAPAPAPDASNLSKYYLDFGYYDGASAGFITATNFLESNGLFGWGAHPQRDFFYTAHENADLHWISVKDQFFSAVLTPKDIAGKGFYVQGVSVKVDGTMQETVTGDLELGLGLLGPGAEKKLELTYYAGPKEYVRLDRLGDKQDLNMQFGWFGFISKILLLALMALRGVIVPVAHDWSWALSIVLFTIIMKLLTWRLTTAQVRTSRRMAKFQGPMKALQAKYKDNPQKLQMEMMELYKKHKINPLAGCLPMLIQLPIFFAFYSVLRTASEMRFQSFLWIHDLSAPDTLFHVGGLAINPLPLFMGASMLLQMRMTPSPSMDPTQKMIMQFMPLMFLFSFYTLPSGLVLYSTCNNIFTIIQQYYIKRQPDDPVGDVPTPVSDRPTAKRQ